MPVNNDSFDVKNFLNNWGKALDDIRTCNKTLAAGKNTDPIGEIIGARHKDGTLSECLSAIESIVKYLSHDDEKVRNLAGNVIALLVKNAAEHISNENDPAVILSTAKILFKVMNKLESNSSVSLTGSSKRALSDAKKIIDKKIDGILKQDKDEFIDSSRALKGRRNKGSNLPESFNRDKFVRSIDKATETLIGNTTYDQFVKSIDKSMQTLIGSIGEK